ncbi:MAG: type II secretion system protein N, partial [Burkholderiales bacterium]|nr:type II secretion system protein N [Burkholderiales bacterium]
PAFAPAAWLARWVAAVTDQRLLLADARGSVWNGSAVPVLTGGPDSRDASSLPDRLHWTLGLEGLGLALHARQACCLNGTLHLRLVPGFGRWRFELVAAPPPAAGRAWVARWPASWLVGLGTPWNTVRPSGQMELSSPGLTLELVQGRLRFSGDAALALDGVASRLSTLDPLGSYRLSLHGDAARGMAATLRLDTIRGPLQLSGSGDWVGSRLRFSGRASADEGSGPALLGLLGIIGRREGAAAVFSIG